MTRAVPWHRRRTRRRQARPDRGDRCVSLTGGRARPRSCRTAPVARRRSRPRAEVGEQRVGQFGRRLIVVDVHPHDVGERQPTRTGRRVREHPHDRERWSHGVVVGRSDPDAVGAEHRDAECVVHGEPSGDRITRRVDRPRQAQRPLLGRAARDRRRRRRTRNVGDRGRGRRRSIGRWRVRCRRGRGGRRRVGRCRGYVARRAGRVVAPGRASGDQSRGR